MRFYTFGNQLPQSPQPNDPWSGVRFWLTVLLITWTLSALGLGWVINSVFIFLSLIVILPIIGIFGLQWWVKRNIITDSCPTCTASFSANRGTRFQCPSCGEILEEHNRHFVRPATPGVIDVDVQVVDEQY